MCIGIPMQVIECGGVAASHARCRAADGEHRIDTLLIGEVAPGDWLLCSLGVARERIDAAHADSIRRALAALGAVRDAPADAASAVHAAFADLIEREPTLPPHLQALRAAPADPASTENR